MSQPRGTTATISSTSVTNTISDTSESNSRQLMLSLHHEETTSSSISSFQSSSDVVESPIKSEPITTQSEPKPIMSGSHVVTAASPTASTSSGTSQPETVTMSMDEVMQFAQPIVTDYY